MRLTEAQRDLLSYLTNGWTLSCRQQDNHWWLRSNFTIRPHIGTIRFCVRQGYICRYHRCNDVEDWTLTPSGRAALAQSKEKS